MTKKEKIRWKRAYYLCRVNQFEVNKEFFIDKYYLDLSNKGYETYTKIEDLIYHHPIQYCIQENIICEIVYNKAGGGFPQRDQWGVRHYKNYHDDMTYSNIRHVNRLRILKEITVDELRVLYPQTQIWINDKRELHRDERDEYGNLLPAYIEQLDEECDRLQKVKYYHNGQLHNDNDNPAIIKYYFSGNLKCKEWFNHGSQHRDNDEPAHISYFGNDKCCDPNQYYKRSPIVKHEIWYRDNDYGRLDGSLPCSIIYYDDGHVYKEEWTCVNLPKNHPQQIYYKNDEVYKKKWYLANKPFQTLDGHNYLCFLKSQCCKKEYYENGKLTHTWTKNECK